MCPLRRVTHGPESLPGTVLAGREGAHEATAGVRDPRGRVDGAEPMQLISSEHSQPRGRASRGGFPSKGGRGPWASSFEFTHDDAQRRVTLQTPVGEPYKVSFQIAMGPGQTLRLPFEFTVHNSYPKGTYALTLDAIEVKHPVPMSTATATLTIM